MNPDSLLSLSLTYETLLLDYFYTSKFRTAGSRLDSGRTDGADWNDCNE